MAILYPMTSMIEVSEWLLLSATLQMIMMYALY